MTSIREGKMPEASMDQGLGLSPITTKPQMSVEEGIEDGHAARSSTIEEPTNFLKGWRLHVLTLAFVHDSRPW